MLKKIRKMLKQQEGFTLVELMIVVVILGILSGIGIQQYGAVQERARAAAHEANLKIITSSANMYLMMENSTNVDALLSAENAQAGLQLLVDREYLDDLPTNPYGTGEAAWHGAYGVTVTADAERYTIEVSPSVKP